MPLITIDKQDLLHLLGESVSDEDLAYNISMMGTDLREVTEVIDVEIFPDRPDLLSTEGFAMALEGYLGIKTEMPVFTVHQKGYTAFIDHKVASVRPYAVCAIVKDVVLSDGAVKSLMQVQEKLHITHGRNRKKVAIGVHDLDKITFPVTYTTKPLDFSFVPLEWYTELTLKEILNQHKKGIQYAHLLEGFSEYPLWIDSKGTVLSMPPIINSDDTKVEPDTHHLFLDVTGYSRKALEQALNILVCSLARRGGNIYAVQVFEREKEIEEEREIEKGKKGKKENKEGKEYWYPNLTPQEMDLDLGYVNRWLGLSLSWDEVRTLLERMRYQLSNHIVKIPPYRADILHPVDIMEDIAKAYGLDNIQEVIPEISTIGEEDPLEVFSRRIANVMAGFGLLEVKTYYLTSREFFEKTRITDQLIQVENAVTAEYNVLRNWLLPGMLYTLQCNKHYEYPQNIYEIGEVINLDDQFPEKTREELHAACAICHPKASFTEAKEMLKALCVNLGMTFRLKPAEHPVFIPQRCGSVLLNAQNVGITGEVHPEVLIAWDLEVPVACFELDLGAVYALI
ncbi:MAG: phenylalanine--tRNA ligase subunit beta [Theionarchaea archaeon]|nr:phenylalanine--tRNA ligase subunit beta [Theionarchaea archaeon]